MTKLYISYVGLSSSLTKMMKCRKIHKTSKWRDYNLSDSHYEKKKQIQSIVEMRQRLFVIANNK